MAYTVAYNKQHRTRKAVASLIEQSALEQEGADAYLKYSLQTLILKSCFVYEICVCWSKMTMHANVITNCGAAVAAD